MYKEFPKWKYKGPKGIIVQNREEEAALGDGWGNVRGYVKPVKPIPTYTIVGLDEADKINPKKRKGRPRAQIKVD